MNLPNALTLSRIPLLFVIAGLLYMDQTWHWPATVALVVFVLAALTDWLDGYYARRMKLVSNFGKLMDALTDKILVVGVLVVLQCLDLIPAWGMLCLLLILSREFLITGLRLVAASKGVVLAAERGGKVKTVFQLSAIILYLACPMVRNDWNHWFDARLDAFEHVIFVVAHVTYVLATVMAFVSGVGYLVKYGNLLFHDDTSAA